MDDVLLVDMFHEEMRLIARACCSLVSFLVVVLSVVEEYCCCFFSGLFVEECEVFVVFFFVRLGW